MYICIHIYIYIYIYIFMGSASAADLFFCRSVSMTHGIWDFAERFREIWRVRGGLHIAMSAVHVFNWFALIFIDFMRIWRLGSVGWWPAHCQLMWGHVCSLISLVFIDFSKTLRYLGPECRATPEGHPFKILIADCLSLVCTASLNASITTACTSPGSS